MNVLAGIVGSLFPPDPTKAKLHCLEMAKWDIEFPFNPERLTLKRSVHWDADCRLEGPWPMLNYDGGKADTLEFTILLDETEVRDSLKVALWAVSPLVNVPFGLGPKNENSILPYILAFYRLTMPIDVGSSQQKEQRPPLVAFLWEQLQFVGVVEDVTVNITLFDTDGRPKRATVDLGMEGRALSMVSTTDEMFKKTEYKAPKGDSFRKPSTPLLGDARLDVLAKLTTAVKDI